MDELCGRFDGVGTPFFHAGSVDVLSCVLCVILASVEEHQRCCFWEHTSKVIHEIGWSSGISVLLTNSSVRFSSSNWTVKIAPGGVLEGLY